MHDAGDARELAGLKGQIEAARAVLVRLLQDVVEAEFRLGNQAAVQLLEANEQLVIAALRNQAEAETATHALDEASRSAGLDALTQLPNRTLLLDRFDHAISTARRRSARLALLFIDLDNFKHINDTFGHAVGDAVLQNVARALEASVRDADTVSRHGGDEFLILLGEVSLASDATHVADKVIAALRVPIRIGEDSVSVAASIGISVYPDDGDDPATLIDRADSAMYLAKRQGLSSFVFYGKEPDGERCAPTPDYTALRQALSMQQAEAAGLERRNAELREANERLILAALSAGELQVAAEEALRRQAAFLQVLSTELGDPQAPIRIAADTLGPTAAGESLLPRMEALLRHQSEQMSRLLGDLLDVSALNSGTALRQPKPVAFVPMLEAVVRGCMPQIVSKRQGFALQSADASPMLSPAVRGDAQRLIQAFGNLLTNASTFTPAGGDITVSVAVEGDTVLVEVWDNGIGIARDMLSRIFEPFVQDHRATGMNTAGLGLGLTVARRIIAAHGGTVEARSAGQNKGSEFVVMLPLLRADSSG